MKAELTKQHFSTRIFKSYLWYLRTHYPSIDLHAIASEAGLSLEYISDENNWVSVLFDAEFTRLCVEKTGCQDLCYKVGYIALSEEMLGTGLHLFLRYAATPESIYKNMQSIAARFTRVTRIETIASKPGLSVLRLTPITDQLNEREKRAIKENLINVLRNTEGYLESVPVLFGQKQAKVSVTTTNSEAGIPVFELSVRYTPSRRTLYLANIPILSLVALTLIFRMLLPDHSLRMAFSLAILPGLGLAFLWHRYTKLKQSFSKTDETLQKLDEAYLKLQNAKETLQRRFQENQLVNVLSENLTKVSSRNEVLRQSCNDIVNTLHYDRVLVLVANPSGEQLVYGASHGGSPQFEATFKQYSQPINIESSDPRKISNAFRTGSPFLIDDVEKHLPTLNQESREALLAIGSRSFLCVAILSEKTKHGVLCVDYHEQLRQLTQGDLELMQSVGRQIALALDREAAIEASIAALTESDRIKDEFLANTSHELRTPLNGIIGIAESLLDGASGPISDSLCKNLEMIRNSGKRLCSLVNDILDFSRMKNADLTLNRQPVGLREIAEVSFALLAPLALKKGLTLRNEIETSTPAADADEDRVQQIMLNLIGNSLKFTEAGHVRAFAKTTESQIEICIEDTGKGITPENWELVFEPFKQEVGSGDRHFGGTGLGLSITKSLVELHGGTIHLESYPGKGTTVSFTLPIANGTTKPLPQKPISLKNPQLTQDIDSFSPLRTADIQVASGHHSIMIVDDDPVNTQVLVNHLGHRGFQLKTIDNGKEAVSLIQNGLRPDLILLDVMMPEMTGHTACKLMRKHLPATQIPIIFLTAKSRAEDVAVGLSMGANDYLVKPFSKEELLARITMHLDLSKTVSSYCRFVPFEFIELLNRKSIVDVSLGDNTKRDMTILFADIRGFSSLSEQLTPIETFRFLNSYFESVAPGIRTHGGFIDKYVGDGLMAIFPNSPLHALEASVELTQRLADMNGTSNELGRKKPLHSGIGINRGPVILGTIGYDKQMQGTVISDVVNTAARFESLTKEFQVSIITSISMLEELGLDGDWGYRFLGEAKVKGKQNLLRIAEVFRSDSLEQRRLKLKSRTPFESAVSLYLDGQLSAAELSFHQVLAQNPHDTAVRSYLRRIIEAQREDERSGIRSSKQAA